MSSKSFYGANAIERVVRHEVPIKYRVQSELQPIGTLEAQKGPLSGGLAFPATTRTDSSLHGHSLLQQDSSPAWTEEAVEKVQINLMRGIFACRTPEAVRGAVSFAQFLRSNEVNNKNWGLFMQLLDVENHWVVDALIGDSDPYLLLSPIQPNYFMLHRVFHLLTKWHPREIYPRCLQVLLGVLQITYTNPHDGYEIYPLTVVDAQNLGKHLNPRLGQDDNINRFILDILDKISELGKIEDDAAAQDKIAVGHQANFVRNGFFDHKKSLVESIPQVLLVEGDYAQGEVPPELDGEDEGMKESLRIANKRIQDLQEKFEQLEKEKASRAR